MAQFKFEIFDGPSTTDTAWGAASLYVAPRRVAHDADALCDWLVARAGRDAVSSGEYCDGDELEVVVWDEDDQVVARRTVELSRD